MKLRLKDNSLRLRLSQSDLKQFSEEQRVEALTSFGVSALTYALEITDEAEIYANYEADEITIFLPENKLQQWVDTDLVGFEHQMLIDDDIFLKISIEKDFQCLHRDLNEEEKDNFPNPNK